MIDITAAVATSPEGPFSLSAGRLEEPRAEEVRVRIRGVGICHTDLVMKASGYFNGGVLGHEGAGIVEKVGEDVTDLAPGDHVVLSYFACHHCATCGAGQPAYCERFTRANASGGRLDGSSPLSIGGESAKGVFFYQSSFATHAIAHRNNAVKVDASLPIEILGPLGCGFQTGAGAVLNTLQARAGEGIAIFGAGAVGLAATMAAKAAGADPIIVVDRVDDKLETARRLGATHTLNGAEVDVVEEIQRIRPGGVHHALECVGVPTLLEQAVAVLRPTGTCALLGVGATGASARINLMTLLQGRTLKGVIEGDSDPRTFIPRLIGLYQEGRFPFDTLVRTYPFDQINQAIEDMASGRVVKPVLLPD